MPADLFPELDTPALLLDLDVLEANLDRMAAALAGGSCGVRSHFKAHRMAEISRRQIARGAMSTSSFAGKRWPVRLRSASGEAKKKRPALWPASLRSQARPLLVHHDHRAHLRPIVEVNDIVVG